MIQAALETATRPIAPDLLNKLAESDSNICTHWVFPQ
jgi:hypothetical protein